MALRRMGSEGFLGPEDGDRYGTPVLFEAIAVL